MKLSVEGYKSIASKRELEFDGLTVLAGSNSSGKSSFMQPFLILKQTIENHYDSGYLILSGDNAKLTDSTQLISKVPGYEKSSFTVSIEDEDQKCSVVYSYKKGIGLQVDSVRTSNGDLDGDLTLKIGMKSEDIQKSIPAEKFSFIQSLYAEQKLIAKWKVIRKKCFLSAELSVDEKSLYRLGLA